MVACWSNAVAAAEAHDRLEPERTVIESELVCRPLAGERWLTDEPAALSSLGGLKLRLSSSRRETEVLQTCMGVFLSSGFLLLPVPCLEVCPGKAGMFSRRQSCRGKSQSPVVWIAEEMETEPSKPIDKISRGEITSHRAVSKENALWPRKR